MENIYILMLIALVALAAIDLVVGVSNDAVHLSPTLELLDIGGPSS